MRTEPNHMTVAEFCAARDRRDVLVNREYQRAQGIWPHQARSYLIETILTDFPIPKMALHQKLDLKSRRTIKEIVDGQQRSQAIYDFFHNDLVLSRNLGSPKYSGLSIEQLEEEDQAQFLSYTLDFDLFTGATEDEVREAFRRINFYTAPLNAEEQRHAQYQGEFKWFIVKLTRGYDPLLKRWGVFGETQLLRMGSAKLFAEVSDAWWNGIRTTKKDQLNRLYRRFEDDFPGQASFEECLNDALDEVGQWEDVHHTDLMKPHVFYACLLALMIVYHSEEIPEATATQGVSLHELVPDSVPAEFGQRIDNVVKLAYALEDPESAPENLDSFVQSCSGGGTNVKEKRLERVRWLIKAQVESL